jgi:hypothetical protein
MPSRHTLKIGDRIRLLTVPAGDVATRQREIAENADMAGWTAGTIERILKQDPTVTISSIDEYGHPWFEYVLIDADGNREEHSLAIMEDESWMLL